MARQTLAVLGMKQVMTTLPADIRNRKKETRNNSTHTFDNLDGKNHPLKSTPTTILPI